MSFAFAVHTSQGTIEVVCNRSGSTVNGIANGTCTDGVNTWQDGHTISNEITGSSVPKHHKNTVATVGVPRETSHTLPATGSTTEPLLGAASLLLIIGIGALYASRRSTVREG